jgi:hypothetical protein
VKRIPALASAWGAVLHALSIASALAAVAFMALAIAGMVTGNADARRGFTLRAGAVLCFAAAVILNVAR